MKLDGRIIARNESIRFWDRSVFRTGFIIKRLMIKDKAFRYRLK